MCNCRLWLRSISEPGVQLSAKSKAHKVQLQARGMACILLAGASKAPGSTMESSPVPRRLSSSLSPNQAAGSRFGDGRDALCAAALPISATCTPVAHPAAQKGPKDQRASRARFPDGDYCCHSRVSTRAPNTLTRVLDFSEWFIKAENKQLDHVEICSKLGGHNRKLISGRKVLWCRPLLGETGAEAFLSRRSEGFEGSEGLGPGFAQHVPEIDDILTR